MRKISAAICLLVFVAFTADAHTIPEEESTIDATLDRAAESAAHDAVHVGEILREVAQTLAADEEINSESDEYFLRALWGKTKDALKNATRNVKQSVKGAYKEAKGHIKRAAKDAKQKLKHTVAEIISILVTRTMSGYALEDSDSRGNFITMFIDVIMRTAQRYMKMGKALENIHL